MLASCVCEWNCERESRGGGKEIENSSFLIVLSAPVFSPPFFFFFFRPQFSKTYSELTPITFSNSHSNRIPNVNLHPHLTSVILNLLVRPLFLKTFSELTQVIFSLPLHVHYLPRLIWVLKRKKNKKNPLFKICLTRTYILTQTHSFLLSSLLSCLRFTRVFPLYCLYCVLVVAFVCCVSLFSPYDYH